MFPDNPFESEGMGGFGPPERDPADYAGSVDIGPGVLADVYAPLDFADVRFEDLDFSGFTEIFPSTEELFAQAEELTLATEADLVEYFMGEGDPESEEGDWRGPFETAQELGDWLAVIGLWPLAERIAEAGETFFVLLRDKTL